MKRIELLTEIANDPARSDSDRQIARRALSEPMPDPAVQSVQDSNLELALTSGKFSSSRDYFEFCDRLDPLTKQLKSDINDPILLAILPPDGAEERLKSLYERTRSELVKQQVLTAL